MKSVYPKYKAEFIHQHKKIVRCKRCGSPLRSEESRERGFGKGCLEIMFNETVRKHMKEEVPYIEYGDRSFQSMRIKEPSGGQHRL